MGTHAFGLAAIETKISPRTATWNVPEWARSWFGKSGS